VNATGPPHATSAPSAPEALRFTVTLTERGYRGVLMHLAALRLRFVPPALGFAALLAYTAGMRTEAIGLFAAALAIPIVLWGYLAWVSASPSSRSLYVPVEYELTGSAIVFHSEEGDGEIEWERVARWREAAEHILIYVTGSTYLLVPLSELETTAHAALEEQLRERVGPPARRARRMR
jgi:hypothetical protein